MPLFLKSKAAAIFLALHAVVLFLALATAGLPLRAEEPRLVALHGLDAAEVRSQGFTLPRPMKVHVYARGAGLRAADETRGFVGHDRVVEPQISADAAAARLAAWKAAVHPAP